MIFDNFGDYLISLDNNAKAQFMDLHNYFTKGGKMYMDILALHEEDLNI
jgi:hypothetical protein